ncbi:selenide, water dikinase SelD [Roseivivax isoporae]|uniref:Segregation protein B n=1 Tax=Roseivivax isoporae LMG 25204 TaxID=1449351 RepID=X7FCZ0_9RHOB|nr:selenide, water dikinase SelD [Roseivivax isoporae]ETX30593.1 segregation protein B [Roseivivax isoporae LMG 25204]
MLAAPPLPLTRDLVLIGGGHTHALVLRRWGMKPLPGVRLTVIDPTPATAYSGMLPGFVAGHYPREALEIDLVRLARFAGARLILGRACDLDLHRREIAVEGRTPVGFDVASLDIGVTSDMPDLVGFGAHAVPAKPLGPFAERWERFLASGAEGDAAVIGAGIAGTELALAMAHRLAAVAPERQVHLLDSGRAVAGLRAGTRRRLGEALRAAAIVLHEDVEITRVDAAGLVLADGTAIPAAFVAGAAGARAQPWLARSGLHMTDGFVTVGPRLQSSAEGIFAVGDCAHMAEHPRPKAGVYAVRQAPVLDHNLRVALGRGGYRRYRPQRDYLKLVSLGGTRALGDRFGLSFSGGWVWRWKDRIDRRFMEKLSDLPRMPAPDLPWPRARGLREALGPKPMCGGCGAKVGRGTLNDALRRISPPQRDDVERLANDDAAVLVVGGVRQVISTDHLRALWPDPAVMTRISAVHALNDVHAMAAAPQAATANVILPRLSDALAARTLQEILQTAEEVLRAAGADLVGGHTSVGDELSIGFSVTGLCDGAPVTLSGGRPGDALILTKGLGSGTIMAAEMDRRAGARTVAAALAAMTRSEALAAHVLRGARAMTDVTGFGLAGHLQSLAAASGTGAELWLHAIPHLDGALALAARGVRSSLYPQNRAVMPDLPETAEIALVFDPQTAGGLLAAVAPEDARGLLAALHAEGYTEAAQIGWLTGGMAGQIDVTD